MKNNYRDERRRKYTINRTEESWAAFCQEIYNNNQRVIEARLEREKQRRDYDYDSWDLVA